MNETNDNKTRDDHMARIAAHYAHALEKHPRFADVLDYHWNAEHASRVLAASRRTLLDCDRSGWVAARDVLNCEVCEVYDAWHRGRFADAVEECYDAAAVLLRMADMIAAERDGAAEGGAK